MFLDRLFDYQISVRVEIFDVDCSLLVEVLTEVHLSNSPARSSRLILNFKKMISVNLSVVLHLNFIYMLR